MGIKEQLQKAADYYRQTNNGQVLVNVVDQVIEELGDPEPKDELESLSEAKTTAKKKKAKV